MLHAGWGQTATLMPSGEVLVAGGATEVFLGGAFGGFGFVGELLTDAHGGFLLFLRWSRTASAAGDIKRRAWFTERCRRG